MKNWKIALLILTHFLCLALGYMWHFKSNEWASRQLRYYFYGHVLPEERGLIPEFPMRVM